jgi:hypothetical protein
METKLFTVGLCRESRRIGSSQNFLLSVTSDKKHKIISRTMKSTKSGYLNIYHQT